MRKISFVSDSSSTSDLGEDEDLKSNKRVPEIKVASVNNNSIDSKRSKISKISKNS